MQMFDVAVNLIVNAEQDYYYGVDVSCEEMRVTCRYNEMTTQQVNFGSVEEMRAVAKAMLTACNTFIESNK